MDCNPPGSSVHGILQVKILELVAMPSSRGSFQPRFQICISCIAGRFLPLSHRGSISSVAQSCLTLCDPMNRSTPGLPVHHQLPEFTQTHVHRVSDAIQPSHSVIPFSSCLQSFQHQDLFQSVSSHQAAKVFEFQLQHQSFQ